MQNFMDWASKLQLSCPVCSAGVGEQCWIQVDPRDNGGDPGVQNGQWHNARKAVYQEVYDLIKDKLEVTENTSDGYHSFKELYAFRKQYNAAFFNEIQRQGYNVHKSKKHHDGQLCFGGGWFIVMATLPTGQISNHYELSDWDLFFCEERETADEWDGHTPQDVLKRLNAWNRKIAQKSWGDR